MKCIKKNCVHIYIYISSIKLGSFEIWLVYEYIHVVPTFLICSIICLFVFVGYIIWIYVNTCPSTSSIKRIQDRWLVSATALTIMHMSHRHHHDRCQVMGVDQLAGNSVCLFLYVYLYLYMRCNHVFFMLVVWLQRDPSSMSPLLHIVNFRKRYD